MQTIQKIILHHATVERIGHRPAEVVDQLARIYFQSWHHEGLCSSFEQASAKIRSFNLEESFAVFVDEIPYAMVNSFLSDLNTARELISHLRFYISAEQAAASTEKIEHPRFRVCFSITALPGYRVAWNGTDTSLAQFLLKNLPNGGVYIVPYSRHPAVGMHLKFGALPLAILDSSRPEDVLSDGQNVIMVYPKNANQQAKFEQIAAHLTCCSPIIHQDNARIFKAVLDLL